MTALQTAPAPTVPYAATAAQRLQLGDFRQVSQDWPAPTAIVCDGPYGLSCYDGDLASPQELADWYQPHIQRFAEAATAQTTLWFWNTEIGWANVHPVLIKHGWRYHSANIWDKGLPHIAGNSNTQTLRRFPVVSEICVQYVRQPTVFRAVGAEVTLQDWLRSEWQRSGLPLNTANQACGVASAATRKYLTADELWYMPPPEVFQALVDYANQHGNPDGRPYFADHNGLPLPRYEQLRAKFHCPAAVTNVWRHNTVPHHQRTPVGNGLTHPNEKPIALIERIIAASTEPHDVVWDPFSGVGTAAVACALTDRLGYAAEIKAEYWRAAQRRMATIQRRLL